MRPTTVLLSVALLGPGPLLAGAVFEMETTDHRVSPPRVTSTEVMADGHNLRMQVPEGGGEQSAEVIFHGESRRLILIDHEKKSYFVVDRDAIEAISAQLEAATRQMEQALASVPAEQRAMMEKMMKSRMPGAAGSSPTPVEIHRTGDTATHHGYPCVKYELRRDGQTTGELWVTEWDNVDGAQELASTFEAMSELFTELATTASRAAGRMGGVVPGLDDNPFGHLKELQGFPVLSRELVAGELGSESALRGARERAFEPGAFDPPARYKKRELFEGR